MGGKEGSRGYLYQAFASTLEALTEEFWNKIHIEFQSEKDKVDIALELDGRIIKTIQVKSSVNLFSRSDILKWLSDLIDDFPSGEYVLYLIGGCEHKASTLIKSIRKYNDGIDDAQSKDALKNIDSKLLDNKISIKIIPFDSSTLESIVRDSLNKYISHKGYLVKFEGLNLIAKGVELTFMLLSTNGKAIEREDFDRKIIKWIEITLGDYLNSVSPRSKHEIMFYIKSEQKFSKSIREINILHFHGYKSLSDKYYKRIKEVTNRISKIQLPTHTRHKERLDENDNNNQGDMNVLSRISAQFASKKEETFLEIDDKEKISIIESIKHILNIDIDKSFFFVGELREVRTTDFMNQSTYEKQGTTEEIKKYEYITELESLIIDYKLLKIFISEMTDCSILPLIIKNTSELSDSDLKIKLYIPKAVNLFKSSNYPLNEYIKEIPKPFAEIDGIIDKIFTIKPDSMVSVESEIMKYDPRTLKTTIPNILGNNYNDGYTNEDFYNVLDSNIGQTVHEDDEHYHVIEYDIKQLYSNEVKALRNILVIQSLEEDIEIKYKILSSNSDGSIAGILEVKKNIN